MKKGRLFNYFVALLLGLLMFASNFLNTSLFSFGDNNFAVWFVISILCFACGWYINKTLGWQFGGKVVFAMIIAATFISIVIITFFQEYFHTSELIAENLILYSLRNITLGSMAIFGMAIVEILSLQKEMMLLKEKNKVFEDLTIDAKKESELEIKEAKVRAEKIMNEAELDSKKILMMKEKVERELKEFIQAEKELIKKYENL
ncbi:MAG: hypothetical protein IPM56_00710 [Ignavibacteriales bacterium]|nr:MAG: hypothetical protein IPM56_00710 [Ignavibacteriales bacterium]